MRRHLLMRLRAPLIAFGGETIDAYGVVREFPALSMVTGLLGNALGYERSEGAKLDRLQGRIVMGTRIDRRGEHLQDFQTAQLAKRDQAWTTRGEPDTRQGGEDSYKSPHLRFRDYRADLDALVALRLEPADEEPTLDALAQALDRPKRPLFIGRKPCMPSSRVFIDIIDAENVLDALQRAPGPAALQFRFQWPEHEGVLRHARATDICDERIWTSGVHGGWRRVLEGSGARVTGAAISTNMPERTA